jgi:hypothetical protein
MKDRLAEFQQEVNQVELSSLADLKAWLNSWIEYVKKGGVRPGHPH